MFSLIPTLSPSKKEEAASRSRHDKNDRVNFRLFLSSLGNFLMIGKTNVIPNINTKEFSASQIKSAASTVRNAKEKLSMNEISIKILKDDVVEVKLKDQKKELSVELRFDELVYLQTVIQSMLLNIIGWPSVKDEANVNLEAADNIKDDIEV
eukprot:TRINITY_DN3561_c0_g1_i1.p1 TRINITY_DN3561_c0_g1~~TRINITY_DN3561_c0_g1_i1.p1  ORF type:complete len:152 (+),score=21.28 TRINITY_DN3561_c0_g1_i1:284-739(+)